MVRGGVPQSIAMRVTGHRSRSMFDRYDIASLDDKLEALHRAREYASTRKAVGENVSAFPSRPAAVNPTGTPEQIGPLSQGTMVAVQGFEPREERNTTPTESNDDTEKMR